MLFLINNNADASIKSGIGGASSGCSFRTGNNPQGDRLSFISEFHVGNCVH
jgi:hypothetical protein